MRLIHLFLRQKEHEIKHRATERTLLGREMQELDGRHAQLNAQYDRLRHTTPVVAQEAAAAIAYLQQLRRHIDQLNEKRKVMQDAITELTRQLERHYGEKRALERYKERQEHQQRRNALYKENETANESFTHRFHFAR